MFSCHYTTVYSMNLHNGKNSSARRGILKKETGVLFTSIARAEVNDEKNVKIENNIGGTSIPLGVAGPLLIRGRQIKSNYYIPLATTEGALVASVQRGCKAIGLSGGVSTDVGKVGTTRGPVFYVSSLKEYKKFSTWLSVHEEELKKEAEKTSNHLQYKKMDVQGAGNYVYTRFYFDTDDAMGMNMVTMATQTIAAYIKKKVGIECLALAGNFDVDKKPSWMNFINHRGMQVWAEIIVPASVVQKVLHTTSRRIYDVWLAKCMIGSAISGSMGFNAHYANVVAAFFAATGQDLAHVVEGSMGITTTNIVENESLYFSVYLPAVMMATVGGGTKYETQKEAIALTQAKNVEELGEVLGGAVLAGELSLLASLAEGSLAQSHQKLGR